MTFISRLFATIFALMVAGTACALTAATEQETHDWGVPPTSVPKTDPLHAPTPTSIPRGKTILAGELYEWMRSESPPVVIDLLGGEIRGRRGLPGAIYLGARPGLANFPEETKKRFATALDKLTSGDRSKAIVFYCLSSECWVSYNASIRAIEAGYTNVYWYRGGLSAWKELGYPGVQAKGYYPW